MPINAPFGNEGEDKRHTEHSIAINVQKTKSEADDIECHELLGSLQTI